MFLLTALRPISAGQDLYIAPGDRIGINHLCRAGVGRLFGRAGLRIKTMGTAVVEIAGSVLERP